MASAKRKKIFLDKSWIIKERLSYLKITAPKQYFNQNLDPNINTWICLPRSALSATIVDSNWFVVMIDLEQVYQIISFNYETAKIEVELILGKTLYQELEAVEKQVRWIAVAKKNNYLKDNLSF